MDGVLVDTGPAHYEAWVQTLAKHDLPFSYAQFQATFGMTTAAALNYLYGPAVEAEEVRAIDEGKESLFRQVVEGNVRLLPGVLEWLGRLQKQGIRQAIASSAPQANIDLLVHEFGLGRYLMAIVSGAELPGRLNWRRPPLDQGRSSPNSPIIPMKLQSQKTKGRNANASIPAY